MGEYSKPLPRPTTDTQEYWDACKRHELVIQKCSDCGSYRFYPLPICHNCGSMNFEWHKVSGKGTIYSWTKVWHAADETWKQEIPYILAVMELAEQPGLLIPGNLLEYDEKDIRIGMPVEVTFVDVTEEISLPQWRPALQ